MHRGKLYPLRNEAITIAILQKDLGAFPKQGTDGQKADTTQSHCAPCTHGEASSTHSAIWMRAITLRLGKLLKGDASLSCACMRDSLCTSWRSTTSSKLQRPLLRVPAAASGTGRCRCPVEAPALGHQVWIRSRGDPAKCKTRCWSTDYRIASQCPARHKVCHDGSRAAAFCTRLRALQGVLRRLPVSLDYPQFSA